MNILFITPSLPSRLHRIRAFCLIKALSRDHNVHLLSLSHTEPDQSLEEITSHCASVTIIKKSLLASLSDCFFELFGSNPLEIAYCKSLKMNAAVKDLVSKHSIDFVYVKRLRSAQFAEDISLPKILDVTDAMSLFYTRTKERSSFLRRIFSQFEEGRYLRYEKKMAAKYNEWVTCSPDDKRYLENNLKSIRINLIPNVVDTTYHKPDSTITPDPATILFSGLMNKFINSEGAIFLIKKVFPLLKIKLPEIKLFIVGPKPTSAVRNLAQRNIIVTGYTKDIRTYINKSTVVVCPIFTGTGTRNKILQAWAHKKAVVTTTRGLEGLPGVSGVHCLVADDAQTFADDVYKLITNPKLRGEIAENGYKLVQESFSLDSLEKSLEGLLREK